MSQSSSPVGQASSGNGRRPLAINLDLRPIPSAAATARDALDVFDDSLAGPAFSDLRVIVTELVTNSVKYGPGRPIQITVSLDPDGLIRGDVDDGGSGGVAMRTPGPSGGGLGLLIVNALTTWGVRPDSSHVWFELDPAAG